MGRDLFSFSLPSLRFYRSSWPKHGILDGKKKWFKKFKKKGVKTEWCVAFGFSKADKEEKDNGETIMPRSQRNDNFIDKTFTVVADILLKVLPTSQREKQAFMYYRDGMSAQSAGEYAEALQNYYQAMRFETDAYDRSYILYNIGLIHTSNGEHGRALEYYYQALERNPSLPQALNNIAVIYHYRGEQAIENGQPEIATLLFDKAADYWKEAIRLAPTNYIEAVNWLKMSDRHRE